MISVLWKKGFPKELCKWTQSFLSNRKVRISLDDYLSPVMDLKVGVPQGSPASPVLSCLYASSVLEQLNNNPIFSSLNLPVGPRSYIDDVGFLAISDSLHENTILLGETLKTAQDLFNSIGMSIDPDKSDLMHFSWRRNYNASPSLHTTINHTRVTITPPKYIHCRVREILASFLPKRG